MGWAMTTFLTILLILAMGATLVTLFMGMVGMVGDEGGGGRSNALMRYRVLFQGAALAIFALLLLSMRG